MPHSKNPSHIMSTVCQPQPHTSTSHSVSTTSASHSVSTPATHINIPQCVTLDTVDMTGHEALVKYAFV